MTSQNADTARPAIRQAMVTALRVIAVVAGIGVCGWVALWLAFAL
ncbi:hypothetical protein [Amycolatopsis sp. NPDC004625]